MRILYKKSKKGDKLQQWSIEVDGDKYRTIEGFVGGKLTIGEWTTAKPKNVGRANATTAEEQALLEACSKYQKKLDKGYTKNPESCERPFVPTLAKVWKNYQHKVVWPVWVTPKMDGMRCIVTKEGRMLSRERKPIVSCPHIVKEIVDKLELGGIVFDGELYNHELKHDFEEIMSLCKQQKPTSEDLERSNQKVQFHIFDYVDDGKYSYSERMLMLSTSIFNSTNMPDCIKLVLPKLAKNQEELERLEEQYLEQGYEGVMVRWGDDVGYIQDRTNKLLKLKRFEDEEFRVIDVLEGNGKDAGMVSKWLLYCDKYNVEFEAGSSGSDAFNRKIFLDKQSVIGKMATVKFQGRTKENKPRFATFKAIRS